MASNKYKHTHPRRGVPHTEESKKRISDAHVGKTHTDATKKHMSLIKTGKLLSEETKAKMAATHIEFQNKKRENDPKLYQNKEWLEDQYVTKKKTPEQIADGIGVHKSSIHRWLKRLEIPTRSISEACIGRPSSNLGRHHTEATKAKFHAARMGKKLSEEHRKHIAEALTGNDYRKGKNASDETRKRISESHRGLMVGAKNPNWKDGASFEPYCPKFNEDLKQRIRAFFDHRCVLCGKTTKENKKQLSCHHVEYNKNACCDGEPVHFAALCNQCHSKTGKGREGWENMMHRIIDEMYDGRSYFTKSEMETRLR